MHECDCSDIDRRHMARALELAAKGLGRTAPNPMVGAVIAREAAVVAEGWHDHFGGPHAEAVALGKAGPKARGATLVVTLEPCCHHGKTPPCTDAIITAGVARVVAATGDPFPDVAGRGFDRLRDAGIDVHVGLMETEARQLNAAFIKRHTTGRPYVTAKWAQTLDGRLATAGGDSRWISSPPSRQWVHSLRSRMDAIVIGCGTALADDPLLTVRVEAGGTDYGRRPARIVLDPKLRLPADSRLAVTAGETPLLVITGKGVDQGRAEPLEARGATVIEVACNDQGIVLPDLLDELGRRDMTEVLVEGGPAVLASFLRDDLVDRLAVFIAPKLIGGQPRHVASGPAGLASMADAAALLRPTFTQIGDDLLVEGVLRDY